MHVTMDATPSNWSVGQRCSTFYLLIVWNLRVRAAALLHLLPPVSHRSIQVAEFTLQKFTDTERV